MHDKFVYDPTIPEAIRWNIIHPKGRHGNQKGDIAGWIHSGSCDARYVYLNGWITPVRRVVVEICTGMKVPPGRNITFIGPRSDYRITNLRLSKFNAYRHRAEDRGEWPDDGNIQHLVKEEYR